MTNKTLEEKAKNYVDEKLSKGKVLNRRSAYYAFIAGYRQCKEDAQSEVSGLREVLQEVTKEADFIISQVFKSNHCGGNYINIDDLVSAIIKAKQLIKSRE